MQAAVVCFKCVGQEETLLYLLNPVFIRPISDVMCFIVNINHILFSGSAQRFVCHPQRTASFGLQ